MAYEALPVRPKLHQNWQFGTRSAAWHVQRNKDLVVKSTRYATRQFGIPKLSKLNSKVEIRVLYHGLTSSLEVSEFFPSYGGRCGAHTDAPHPPFELVLHGFPCGNITRARRYTPRYKKGSIAVLMKIGQNR